MKAVAERFRLPSAPTAIVPYVSGHINDSYRVTLANGEAFMLQRINTEVFRDVPGLMENILRVTTHLRKKLAAARTPDAARRALEIIHTREGHSFWMDDEGRAWRVYRFIPGTISWSVIQSPDQARAVARAFGAFHSQLSDFPARVLTETIQRFHDTPNRFSQLDEAIRRDAVGRVCEVAAELEHVERFRGAAGRLVDLQARGVLPTRVTHNDTKANNVLVDEVTAEPLCVADLDTVMPSLVLYDFGDMVRTASHSADEDERDLGKVLFRRDLFEALAEGYLDSAGGFLSREEVEQLAFSGVLITAECGVRFLTDYLNGDAYFRTSRPGQNLDRCRVQFRLAEQIQAQLPALDAWIAKRVESVP